MKTGILIVICIITFVIINGCTKPAQEHPKKEKKISAIKELFNKTISEYPWIYEQKEFLKENLHIEEFNGMYKYTFKATEEFWNVDLTDEWEIIRGDDWIAIPEVKDKYENINAYIIFSKGSTPKQVKEYINNDPGSKITMK